MSIAGTIGSGLLVVAAGSLVVALALRLISSPRLARRDFALLAGSFVLLIGGLALVVALDPGAALDLVIGIELAIGGLVIVVAAAHRPVGTSAPPKLLAGLAAGAVAAIVVVGLAAPKEHIDGTLASLATATVKADGGFGPPRPPLRCRRPTSCPGPHYVTLNSYVNNPVVGKEQRFLALSDPAQPRDRVVDSLDLGPRQKQITLRAYIDNDTFQQISGLATTDALDTHLKLALPTQPLYETFPTAYLYAENAHPNVVWDTVQLRSNRPVRFSYVAGSAKLRRRDSSGKVVTASLPGDVSDATGLALGDWPADFRYSGYVTFKLRVTHLPEPVQNPLATWGLGNAAVDSPPATGGLAKEPVVDGTVGEQFKCRRTSCDGPPYPKLDAFENQPLSGDEADFLRGSVVGQVANTGVQHYRSVVVAAAGDRVVVHMAISDGANPSAIGAPPLAKLYARDIEGRIVVPSGSGRELRVVALLKAVNTVPREIVDTLPIRSREDIRLRFAPPHLVALLQASAARWLPGRLVSAEGQPFRNQGWTPIISSLAPSFSRVGYVAFTIEVLKAAEGG